MGDIIKRAFRDTGWSMKRLSDASGTRYASMHAFFTGTRDPALSTIERWCRTLDLGLRPVRRKRKAR